MIFADLSSSLLTIRELQDSIPTLLSPRLSTAPHHHYHTPHTIFIELPFLAPPCWHFNSLFHVSLLSIWIYARNYGSFTVLLNLVVWIRFLLMFGFFLFQWIFFPFNALWSCQTHTSLVSLFILKLCTNTALANYTELKLCCNIPLFIQAKEPMYSICLQSYFPCL